MDHSIKDATGTLPAKAIIFAVSHKHALELYTQVKSVWVDLSGKPIGWFGK